MTPIPNPMSMGDCEVDLEVKVISSDRMSDEDGGLEIEDAGSVGSGTENPSLDNFRLSLTSVRERVRKIRANSTEMGIFTSLRLKFGDCWNGLFGRNRRRAEVNARYEEQEIELMKGNK